MTDPLLFLPEPDAVWIYPQGIKICKDGQYWFAEFDNGIFKIKTQEELEWKETN